nr:ATP-binding cassette domain-containing protein [Nitritalea halalkaliphila]
MSQNADRNAANATVLSSQDLSIGYAKSQAPPLAEGINLQLKKGQLTCLLGANGVGKSTLIQTLLGEVPACRGGCCCRDKMYARRLSKCFHGTSLSSSQGATQRPI